MDEKEPVNGEPSPEQTSQHHPPAKRYIRIKPFAFVMLFFGLILVTATITFFVLTAGEDKVVEVVKPQQKVDRKEFKKLYETFDALRSDYYEDIDEQAAINGAISGMINALGDPYSSYLDKEQTKQLHESIDANFEGIGAEIQEQNGSIIVVSPIKNSPAEKAGILPQDRIVAVDGKTIDGLTSSEAVVLIRGEKGTEVVLTIARAEQEPMEVTITRDIIPIETVYGEMDEDKIAHIRITSFSNRTYEELVEMIEKYETEGMKGIVLDVRQNPGGTLESAADISDLFVPTGKNIFQYQEKGKPAEVYEALDGAKITLPVSVLIDDGSASASEILAAALNESATIPLVGGKTFGKGTVQSPKDLPDGSNLKLTTAKWLTPNGNWIHEKGIKPTIEVPYPSYATLPFINPAEEMKEGLVSPTVKAAEEMLDVLGYKPGEIDGMYDRKTVQAVKTLQKNLSVQQTGVLTGETTVGLLNQLREKITKEDPQLLEAKKIVQEKIQ